MGAGPIVDSAAAQRLFAPIAHAPVEVIAVAYLDARRRVLGMRHVPSFSRLGADVPMRAIVADALAFDAAMVVMAHNHPSGDPTPSIDDIGFTRRLVQFLDPLGLVLLDHLVLAGDRWSSFRDDRRL